MASRDAAAVNPRSGRVARPEKHGPLSKRAWQDIRRALSTQPRADVHAVELHGVKIIYKHKNARDSPHNPSAGTGDAQVPQRGTSSQQQRGADKAEPHAVSTGDPSTQRGNARQRRSRKRLLEFQQAKRAAAAADDASAMQ